jgi:hypothetical protein
MPSTTVTSRRLAILLEYLRISLLSHLARKTFDMTITLTNGINIGVLSKILEHNSIKVTLDS